MGNTKRRILIIDDNLEFAELVGKILENGKYQISIAPDGNTGIEKVLSESPELVLLDLQLPDIPGREILKRIKDINENIAVIIITGYGGEQIAVDLMKAGALDFFSKPVDREILLKAVKNAFEIRDGQIEDRKSVNHNLLDKLFPFLAHEIRNPLHAIGGALAVIERRSDGKDEIFKQSIKIIKDEIQHLNQFVKECLDFVRPPSKAHFAEVEIEEIISVVVNTACHMFEDLSEKIKVVTGTSSNLPKISINYEEIKQVLLNIIKNSFEALEEGGGEIIIRTCFKPSPTPGCIEIVLIDNGIGIRKDNMGHLFHPFFTTKPAGTGLGLAICRRIVEERHHGKISIVSEEGQGTTVKVELPIRQPMTISGEKIR